VRIIDQTNATINAARKHLAGRQHKDEDESATVPGQRKRLGGSVDAPSAKRQKIVQPNESVNADTKVVVLVRFYKNRQDWQHSREARICCNNDGGLDLEEVKEQLGLQGKCRVSRSRRRFQILKTHLSLVT
jgi:hypothetical protein